MGARGLLTAGLRGWDQVGAGEDKTPGSEGRLGRAASMWQGALGRTDPNTAGEGPSCHIGMGWRGMGWRGMEGDGGGRGEWRGVKGVKGVERNGGEWRGMEGWRGVRGVKGVEGDGGG